MNSKCTQLHNFVLAHLFSISGRKKNPSDDSFTLTTRLDVTKTSAGLESRYTKIFKSLNWLSRRHPPDCRHENICWTGCHENVHCIRVTNTSIRLDVTKTFTRLGHHDNDRAMSRRSRESPAGTDRRYSKQVPYNTRANERHRVTTSSPSR